MAKLGCFNCFCCSLSFVPKSLMRGRSSISVLFEAAVSPRSNAKQHTSHESNFALHHILRKAVTNRDRCKLSKLTAIVLPWVFRNIIMTRGTPSSVVVLRLWSLAFGSRASASPTLSHRTLVYVRRSLSGANQSSRTPVIST
jgi:hypothetical protein